MPRDLRNISTLKNWDKNPRGITKDDFERLKKQLKKFGQYKPLLVTEEGTVLGGNMRLKAMQDIGITDVWVSVVDAPDDKTKVEYALSDNDRAGYYEEQQLAELVLSVPELELEEYKVDLKDATTLKDLVSQYGPDPVEDKVPDVSQDEPVSKLGEIYQLGRHRLMCGDALVQWELLNDEAVELCFTSPPYSDQRTYGGGLDLSPEALSNFLHTPAHFYAVNLGYAREDGAIDPYWDTYISKAKELHLKLLSWNVWDRGNAYSIGQQTAMFPIEHEWIFVFGSDVKQLNLTVENKNAGGKTGVTNRQKDGTLADKKSYTVRSHRELGTIIRMTVDRDLSVDHPAKFPVALPMAYIKSMTNEGDTVYDPFGGSGSTLIACEQTGRICYTMEIDPRYCDVIRKRYAKFMNQEDQWQTLTPKIA